MHFLQAQKLFSSISSGEFFSAKETPRNNTGPSGSRSVGLLGQYGSLLTRSILISRKMSEEDRDEVSSEQTKIQTRVTIVSYTGEGRRRVEEIRVVRRGFEMNGYAIGFETLVNSLQSTHFRHLLVVVARDDRDAGCDASALFGKVRSTANLSNEFRHHSVVC